MMEMLRQLQIENSMLWRALEGDHIDDQIRFEEWFWKWWVPDVAKALASRLRELPNSIQIRKSLMQAAWHAALATRKA